MKFRTDYVTNSSSSSFVAMTVKAKNGKSYKLAQEDCSWSASDIFQLTNENERILWNNETINSVFDLIMAFNQNTDYDGPFDEVDYDELSSDETEVLENIQSLNDIDSVSFEFTENIRGSFLEFTAPDIDGNRLCGEKFPIVQEDDPKFEDIADEWCSKLNSEVALGGITASEMNADFDIDMGWPYDQVREALPTGNLQSVIDSFSDESPDSATITAWNEIKL